MIQQLRLLPANHRHTTVCALKPLITDVVFEFLVPYRTANRISQYIIRSIGADNSTQVCLLSRKEAGTQLSIGGQADAVACSAERLTHGVDKANLADAIAKCITSCSLRWVTRGDRHERSIL